MHVSRSYFIICLYPSSFQCQSPHILSRQTTILEEYEVRPTISSLDKKRIVNLLVSAHPYIIHPILRCNVSKGYSWSRTLFLSITLGGFGIDRFYLGLWKSAIGKLFSFGGLGVWTLVDVILVALGYIKPHDDSIYC